ncbi:DNA-directed DNA polymerase, family X, beta-like, N-terminal [Penicillium expansum]|uniref:Crossover junction endonuclease MUS81 n=1 Tax=Penicillium expansum TaxID=27334 RepID=A0A0A2J8S4_PENEN|nr:DNA-directed DNA polymerase, family X, beta-like, N-terminal [Penicillium expansum]KGO44184.1 DNA-directed DNA polymerase, family X, beta-like, N-terminal [Penicillium expansum]KGO51083.1 DNA-directed DNA polymerase, family X, beta-like, N-terminal [Penicillium expansum]KGO55669.1 DNA-directed DNA polymerase, family X, beta-like, N-terminal [Penicillium expansum]
MSEECANPLLLGWIKEWLDQARERNSKGVTVYKKAYESMKACPLEFQHPSQAQQLNGLGPKLCDRLTDKLKAHCQENGLPMPEPPDKGGKRTSEGGVDQPTKKPRKAKPYVPTLRSGPYALMLGLGTQDENASQGMTKAHLIEVAQPYCDSSFTAPPDPTKFYTAWNSMKTLIQKDLVYEHGRPLRKYLLSEEGWEVAKRLQKTLPGAAQTATSGSQATATTGSQQGALAAELDSLQQDDDPSADAQENLSEHDIANIEPIFFPPKSFTIQLVLDTREVRTSTDRDYISGELMKQGITPQVRALEVGDAMWVAKCHDPNFLTRHGEEGDEVMLDWIVERKRLDDLIGSIKDGRFHEQKFRLRRSGIKNVIYLIEEFAVTHPDSTSGSAAQYQEMVASAIASTQVLNQYFIKKTKHLDESIRYLARMTLLLRKMYGVEDAPSNGGTDSNTNPTTAPSSPVSKIGLVPGRRLSTDSYLTILDNLRSQDPSITYGVSFVTFSALTSKSDVLTLRDVFLKMLMCTRGVTGEKALEIQQIWPTPRHLVDAYMALEPKERETMIASRMSEVVGRKKVAKDLSKRIAEVWGEVNMG